MNIPDNPGSGNTFQEINIQNVENYNPNATTVTTTHYHYGDKKVAPRTKADDDVIDTTPIRAEILTYVSYLRPLLQDDWKSCYMKLWEGILDLDAVKAVVYNPGKQQGTNFNRSLVANIIHYLGTHGFFVDPYNAAQMAYRLEGDKEHSVRSALGHDPSEELASRLDRFLDTFLT